jgi:hypothetical protein
MRGAPPHVFVEAAVFLLLCLVAFGSLGYAVWKWRTRTEKKTLPVWRQVATRIAFLAVATQVTVFAVFWIWPGIGRDYIKFGQWARWVDPPFLVALPCAIAGKGAVRWLLLSASLILFVICFLITLSA